MSVLTLSQSIANIMRRQTDGKSIKQGIIENGAVNVDGSYFAYDVAVDIDIADGDIVYTMFSDDKTKAVVVGK